MVSKHQSSTSILARGALKKDCICFSKDSYNNRFSTQKQPKMNTILSLRQLKQDPKATKDEHRLIATDNFCVIVVYMYCDGALKFIGILSLNKITLIMNVSEQVYWKICPNRNCCIAGNL